MTGNASQGSGRKPRATYAKTAPGTNRIPLCVGLGTSGRTLVEMFIARAPNLAGLAMAVDGEIGQEEAMQSSHLIPVPDAPVDDFLANAGSVAILAADPMLRHTRFPHDSERGAGTCRTIGPLKAAGILDQFKQRAGEALRKRLETLKTRERLIIDAHLTAAGGGGFGSGLVLPVALVIRDQVRKLFSQARCYVHVHLILASSYEGVIADPILRRKVLANEYATLLELNAMQSPQRTRRLYDLLDCEAMPTATFDRVVPYHVGDERGRTAVLAEILSERVLPNILAGTDTAVANRLRELSSNPMAKAGAAVQSLTHPMVSVCQAAAAAVPTQLGECWATRHLLKGLQVTLAKPSPERLKPLEASAMAALGIDALYNEVGRMGDDLLKDVLAAAATLKDAAYARAGLLAVHDSFRSTVRPALVGKSHGMAHHFETVEAPRLLAELGQTLLDREARVGEIVAVLRWSQRRVADRAEQANLEAEAAATSAKAARAELDRHIEALDRRGLLASRPKDGAAKVQALIASELKAIRCRTYQGMLRSLEGAIGRAAEEAALVHRQALRDFNTARPHYRRLRDLATHQSGTMVSVVTPDEIDDALGRIDGGIRGAGMTLPVLDVKGMIRDGHLGVAAHVEAHREELLTAFDEYFEANLTTVTGTVRTLNLGFSVRDWIEDTIRNLACCSPVRMSTAGNVEPQTVIAGDGEDHDAVREVLRRSPRLTQLEVIRGSDPRSILVYRRVEGLTIECVPTFPDAKRAAAKFPKPGPELAAFDNLASSGHVLAAFEQAGLMPEEWLIGEVPPPIRQRLDRVEIPNGDRG